MPLRGDLMGHKFNLLVVDDDAAIVRLLSRTVNSRLGDRFEVVALTDPAAALRYFEDNCCHILVSDLEMPGVDGLELLRIAKQRNPWTQVIVITAHSTWDRLSEAIERGASDYLLKPIDHKELVPILEQAYSRLIRWHLAINTTLTPGGIAST
jgi:DNA-binding NtrC family response regulator